MGVLLALLVRISDRLNIGKREYQKVLIGALLI